jgi:GPH family glycoside/pentoside/hexuronide:cation symporter
MSFIPAVFAFLAVVIMVFYRLDNQKLAQVRTELAARKASATAPLPIA